MVREILEEKPISIPEVRAILDNIEEPETEESELDEEALEFLELETSKKYYLKSTHEYVKNFSKLEEDVAKNVVINLVEESKIPIKKAIQIVNINPDTVEELSLIFEKGGKRLSKDDLQDLLFKIREYKEL